MIHTKTGIIPAQVARIVESMNFVNPIILVDSAELFWQMDLCATAQTTVSTNAPWEGNELEKWSNVIFVITFSL